MKKVDLLTKIYIHKRCKDQILHYYEKCETCIITNECKNKKFNYLMGYLHLVCSMMENMVACVLRSPKKLTELKRDIFSLKRRGVTIKRVLNDDVLKTVKELTGKCVMCREGDMEEYTINLPYLKVLISVCPKCYHKFTKEKLINKIIDAIF